MIKHKRFIEHDIKTPSHYHDLQLGEDQRTDYPISFRAKKSLFMLSETGEKYKVLNKGEIYYGTVHSDRKITTWSPSFRKYVYIDKKLIEIGGN